MSIFSNLPITTTCFPFLYVLTIILLSSEVWEKPYLSCGYGTWVDRRGNGCVESNDKIMSRSGAEGVHLWYTISSLNRLIDEGTSSKGGRGAIGGS